LVGTTGFELPLKERRDTFELYPLSAFARGFGARLRASLRAVLVSDSSSGWYPESKDR
jgi:hypothetical protein